MKNFYQVFALTLCLLIASFVQAQDAASLLQLQTGSVKLTSHHDKPIQWSDLANWDRFQGKSFGIIQLANHPNQPTWDGFSAQGLSSLGYFGNGAHLIAVESANALELLSPYGIKASSPIDPAMKHNLDLEQVPFRATGTQDQVIVNIHPYPGISIEETTKYLSAVGATQVEVKPTYHYVATHINPEKISSLAQLSFVMFLDWNYDMGAPENYTSRTLHRTMYLSADNNNGLEYDGSGINVMLQDDGAIGPHIDHEGRILAQFWPTSLGDHGDHVGGTINGAGNISPYAEGQAKGSNLLVYKAAPEYQGFDSIDIHYESLDVLITSTSYSNGCNAGYTALARTMDEQINTMPSLIHVFSAGNSGTSNCNYGAGSGWGNITGGHKVGKNVITVANLDANGTLSGSSSRGPAHDGRIKPDISAKGTSVISTIEDYAYGTKSGTSMSCPGVSGTLAVLYDAYEDIHDTLAHSGLIKALVLNTAKDLGNTGPDFKHGWGQINARKAFEAIDNSYFTEGFVANNDSNQFTVIVPPGLSNARFMLYWTDVEASVNTSTALINDLDLTITDPSNNVLNPYVLDPTPNATALNTPATTGADHLNNMEQVEINNPDGGNYLVKIKGYDVPYGPQKFYLVYWFEQDEVVLTYPLGGESMEPFFTEKIRWDAPTGATGTASLAYSTNGGNSWNTITTTVSIDQEYYDWFVPNHNGPNVKVRLTYNSTEYISDSFSIVAVPTNLDVDYSCPDSIGLSWTGINGATGYTVYRLGEKYMDPIGTSSTTSFVDTTTNPLSPKAWYSVSSIGADGAQSKRMLAVQKSPGVFDCVIAHDAGLVNVFPASGGVFTCHGDSVYPTFEVLNEGQNTLTSITAAVTATGGQTLQQTFIVNIGPNAADLLTFDQAIAITGPVDSLQLVISAPQDGNSYNDTISAVYFLQNEVTLLPIWSEDFESNSICNDDADCDLTECPLDNGWLNEQNTDVDDIDWRVMSGSTFSQFTGPDVDHTTGTTAGKYIYLEASAGCNFKEAWLTSPCIDLNGASSPELTFWYSMYGADMGSLHVDVFDGTIWYESVYSISGNQGVGWNLAEVDLSDFVDHVINIRFRGETGADYRSDMALDDINIAHPPVAAFDYEVQLDGLTVAFDDMSYLADTMKFELGDGTQMDTVPDLFTYPSINVYSVSQWVQNQVGADSTLQLITTLDVNSLELSESMRVFPNPVRAGQLLNITSDQSLGDVAIFDQSGRLIQLFEGIGDTHMEVDIKQLKSGNYFVVADEHIAKFTIVR